jgi:NYN domain-containing protein/OST-HTH/LOTUS domain-containing protein
VSRRRRTLEDDGGTAGGQTASMTDDNRLAVLIDADNTSSKLVKEMFEELAGYGTLTVRRAYGDWTNPRLGGWREALLGNAISPQQQFAYTVGKNATDSALIIDAMDLLYSGNVEGFAIVSSDSDFTRLATRLREGGATVYGLGQRKTPEPFRAACDRFIFLEVLSGGTQDADLDLPDLRRLMTTAVDSTSQDDGWASMSAVGNFLNNTDASFDSRNYGFPKLSSLARAQTYLEVKQDAGNAMRVRVKPAAKKASAKKSTARKRS